MKNQWLSIGKIGVSFICVLFFLLLTGCSKNTPEKIAQAQATYQQLVEIHNDVVDAHKNITDNSLDSQLVTLAEKVIQVESYNLSEMSNEEIDLLINSMDSIIHSYEEYLKTIKDIQEKEEAAQITSILVSILNETDITFSKLCLFRQNSISEKADILEDLACFAPGQALTGLVVYRDAACTPWVLELTDGEGNSYKIELPVETYDEAGCSLRLAYDDELQLVCEGQ